MDENLNNEQLEDNVITLKDEEGNDVDFEFLDVVEYEGNDYVVLLPLEADDEEAEEVIILKEDKDFQTAEDESSYVSVDDENVLNTVFQIFKERFKDEFNFTDED